jgi:hypothetical protein
MPGVVALPLGIFHALVGGKLKGHYYSMGFTMFTKVIA